MLDLRKIWYGFPVSSDLPLCSHTPYLPHWPLRGDGNWEVQRINLAPTSRPVCTCCSSAWMPFHQIPPQLAAPRIQVFKHNSGLSSPSAYHFNSHTLGSASCLSFPKHLPLIFPIFYLLILDNCAPSPPALECNFHGEIKNINILFCLPDFYYENVQAHRRSGQIVQWLPLTPITYV